MKKIVFPLLVALCIISFQSCSFDDSDGIEEVNTDAIEQVNSVVNGDSIIGSPTNDCIGTVKKLQVTYVDPNITYERKKIIRESYNQIFTIYSIQTSPICPNVEIWNVDCEKYNKACKTGCGDHNDEAVIKTPEDVIVNWCFGGSI